MIERGRGEKIAVYWEGCSRSIPSKAKVVLKTGRDLVHCRYFTEGDNEEKGHIYKRDKG